MTQAPTPGPLLKGDIVRGPNGQIETVKSANPDFVVLVSGNGYLPSLVTFIGRPDESGWMPWSGGENPVPGQKVEVKIRWRNGVPSEWPVESDVMRWKHRRGRDGGGDIIAFRLAPTAPVEASGSEREHGPKCWGKTSISDEMMYCYCGSTDSPPGETREALDRLKIAAHVYEDDEMAADCATLEALLSARPLVLGGQKGDSETLRVLLDNLVIAQTLSKDIRQKATDEARSYLYDLRHAPQPSGETREVAFLLDRLADFENDINERDWHGHVAPAVARVKAALSTTPARAEAQDEGAVGEPVALAECPPGLFLWNGTLGFKSEYGAMEPIGSNFKTWKVGSRADAYCADSGEYFWGGTSNHADRDKVLVMPIDAVSAHPSPTPAADADRVLDEAAKYLKAQYGVSYSPTDRARIKNALKSTAAKEGG